VGLEEEVYVIGENPKLLIENAETYRILADVLGRMDGAEEIEDELHDLE
jgi:hypothetical protein